MADEVVQASTSTPPAGEAAPAAVVPSGASSASEPAKTDPKPEAGDNLDKVLREAFDKAKEKQTPPAEAKTGEPPKVEEKPKDGEDKTAKPEGEGEKKVEGAEDSDKVVDPKAAKSGKGAAPQVPEGWSKPAAAKFGSLDPIIRNEILKRQAETKEGVRLLKEELYAIKPHFEDLDRAVTPYKEKLARQGMTPGQAVTQLFALVQHADKDFVGFVKEQAALRGLDLLQALQASTEGSGQEPPKVDPEVAALKQKVAGFESHLHSQRTAAEQQQRQQVSAQVESFQNATDEKGEFKHPHFALVKTHMGALMQADSSLDMEGAYEQACWAHPEIREQLTAKVAADQQEIRAREAEKAANAAKSSTRGAPPNGNPGGRPPVDPKDLDATLRFMTSKAMGEGARL